MKKPSLAEVAVSVPKKPESKPEGDEVYSASADELADILGVASDKRGDFRAALETFVMGCK